MNLNKCVDLLVSKSDSTRLDYKKAAELCGVSQQSLLLIDKFWDQAYNDEKFYISKEFVVECMGHAEHKSTMSDLYKELPTILKKDVDYWEVDSNNEVVKKYFYPVNSQDRKVPKKPGNRKKYFICTADAISELLLVSRTSKGKEVRKYYIEIVKFSRVMFSYTKAMDSVLSDKHRIEVEQRMQRIVLENQQSLQESKLLLEQKTKEAEESKILLEQRIVEAEDSKKCVQLLQELTKDFEEERLRKQKNESIYIVTTIVYANAGKFKIGRTKNLKHRVSSMNTVRVDDDKVYILDEFKTFNSVKLEALIHDALSSLRYGNSREIVRGPYLKIKYIVSKLVEAYNDCVDITNDVIQSILESIKSMRWKDICFTDGIDFSILTPLMIEYKADEDTKDTVDAKDTKSPEEKKRVKKYKEDELTIDEAKSILVKAINKALSKDDSPYSYNDDCKAREVELLWSILIKVIAEVSKIKLWTIKRTYWKEHVKNICTNTSIRVLYKKKKKT